MANYECAYRTNYFRVTDEKKYKELYDGLCGEDIEDFSTTKNGILYHGFGGFGSIDYCENEDGEDPDYNIDAFYEKLSEILPENEAFIYMESGYEKLRYVTGLAVIVTKNEIKCLDMATLAMKQAKDLLGDQFKTQMDY